MFKVPIDQVKANPVGEGLSDYFSKIEDLRQQVRLKKTNLKRLEAQRNEMNAAVKLLKEEIEMLQQSGSYVGDVVKLMGKDKALVKIG